MGAIAIWIEPVIFSTSKTATLEVAVLEAGWAINIEKR
jgi:hypothetical protein